MVKAESEEVNLLDLLSSLYASLRSNIILTIGLPIAGLVIALLVWSNLPKLFESHLIIETSLLSENECTSLISQLKSGGGLPGLTPEENAAVRSIDYRITQNTTENKILPQKTLYIEITAKVFDDSVLHKLQRSIIQYINESPAVARHRRQLSKYYESVIARIDSEIKSMESIKSQITSDVQATYLNPAELYASSFELYKEKMQYEVQLDEIQTVQLVRGFNDSALSDGRISKTIAAVFGFAAGTFLLFLVLFLKYFSRYYSQYQNRQT